MKYANAPKSMIYERTNVSKLHTVNPIFNLVHRVDRSVAMCLAHENLHVAENV